MFALYAHGWTGNFATTAKQRIFSTAIQFRQSFSTLLTINHELICTGPILNLSAIVTFASKNQNADNKTKIPTVLLQGSTKG